MERFWKVLVVCLVVYSALLTVVVLRLAADLYGQIFESSINPWDTRPEVLGSSFVWLLLAALLLLAVCAVAGVAGLLAHKAAAEQGDGQARSKRNSGDSLASQGRGAATAGGVDDLENHGNS